MAFEPLPHDLLREEERLLAGRQDVEEHVRHQQRVARTMVDHERLLDAAASRGSDARTLHHIVAILSRMLDGADVCVLDRQPDGSLRPRVGAAPDYPLAFEALRRGHATGEDGIAVAARPGGRVAGILEVRHSTADMGLLRLAAELVGRCLERQAMMERLVQARQQAEAEASFKQTILYLVTHDVKTPLTAVAMQCQLILNDVLPPGLQQEMLERATRHLERVCLMLDDFMDISRLDSGRLVLDRKRVDVADVAQDVCQLFLPQAKQRGLRIELDAQRVHARADEARLRQVLNNLLSNAIKYTPEGQSIQFRCRGHGGNIAIEVKDKGPGMTQDQVDRLFQPFEQVLDSASQQGGTGLGLYLSRIIIEEHDGRLLVESRPGKGTTFTVALPAADAPRR